MATANSVSVSSDREDSEGDIIDLSAVGLLFECRVDEEIMSGTISAEFEAGMNTGNVMCVIKKINRRLLIKGHLPTGCKLKAV